MSAAAARRAVRIGVIGVGVMGAEHVRLLDAHVSGAEVSAVFDVDATRAAASADESGARVLDDPLALIEDESVDAVLVASSDATHADLVLAALDAGKPVLCEKPLAPTTDACLGIVAAEHRAAGTAGRRLVSLGFMRRFDAGFVAMRGALSSVGAPLVVHCVHRNATSVARTSAELITGSLVHEIDTVRWLLDDEIESVTVHTPRPSGRSGALQDPIVAVFRTSAGVHVDAEVFVNAGYGYDVRCEVVGETGALLLDQVPPVVRRSAGVVGYGVASDWRDRFRDAYRAELQDWTDAVATGRPSRAATAWDGYAAIAVADAGVRALESGTEQKVELASKPELYS